MLIWHWKLNHIGFQWLQNLMSTTISQLQQDQGSLQKPNIIHCQHAGTKTCNAPLCVACCLCRMSRRHANIKTPTHQRLSNVHKLKEGHLQPGNCISLDQYELSTHGRLPDTKGKEAMSDRFCGGTIVVDHASGKIWVHHQVSLRAGETLSGKHRIKRDFHTIGCKVKHYHSDNGVFCSKEFQADLKLHHQTIYFSGVGAHHQNGVAERAIRMVVEWACTLIIHRAMHWLEEAELNLWLFAMNYPVWIWNHLPNLDTGLSPNEIFHQTLEPNFKHLKQTHAWGCPTYILEPAIQDGRKLPK